MCSSHIYRYLTRLALLLVLPSVSWSFAPYETPARPGEWGFHPQHGTTIPVTPPPFTWRPQEEAKYYELEVAVDETFEENTYRAIRIGFNVHTPPELLKPRTYYWRFRFANEDGKISEWSSARRFTIAQDANELPLPPKDDLLARIPKDHPRLFVRPEQISRLKERAQGDLSEHYKDLVRQSERILQNPPDTEEPPLYPDDVKYKSERWREIWWGNREYTIKALNSAATLAFTHLLGGKDEYAELAKEILMACAEWDPKGSTGYRYNDEAGMPYNYYFSRTYTFLNDQLSVEEKEKCREVMRVRGREMYDHLHPRHLWRPYSSHSNRAWHFLGEVGIAFLNEIPEAEQWVWFAANVFTNVYPVWSGPDGGWHEGISYWRSYINRFTWWADVMKTAMGINAYDKPYFSKIGYYPIYLMPPGTEGGGFGDLTAHRDSEDNVNLMTILAAQAQNPHWQWYIEQHGGAERQGGYIGFMRGALPQVEAKAPTDLPRSRLFSGVGQAVLNRTLLNAEENVELIFKSSSFGTQSHGYESNNSFLLYAFGERLLIRSGRRDIYGSEHHRNWMWETKSTNSITINGHSQKKHTAEAQGEILDFQTGERFAYVSGEAASSYEDGVVDQFTRRVLFVKPDTFVIVDRLKTPQPSTLDWHLHSPVEMKKSDARVYEINNNGARARVQFLLPKKMDFLYTDQFDPPPRPRVKLIEYHLTATPTEKKTEQTFITMLHAYKDNQQPSELAALQKAESGYVITLPGQDGAAQVWINEDRDERQYRYQGSTIQSSAIITAVLIDEAGDLYTFKSRD